MKYFLTIIFCSLAINCFSQSRDENAVFVDKIKNSMDLLYEKGHRDLIYKAWNELEDNDTIILIPIFYAMQKYVDIAKDIAPEVPDFEKATGLRRADIFNYIDYDSLFLTDSFIYRSNQFIGIFSQSKIKEEWRSFVRADVVSEKMRHIGNRLYSLSPEYAFYINNISHLIFFIKNDELFCYSTDSDKVAAVTDEMLTDIDITDFAFFLETVFPLYPYGNTFNHTI